MEKTTKPSDEKREFFNKQVADTYKQWAPEKDNEHKYELDQKVAALKYAMEESAETHLEKKPNKNKTIIDQKIGKPFSKTDKSAKRRRGMKTRRESQAKFKDNLGKND